MSIPHDLLPFDRASPRYVAQHIQAYTAAWVAHNVVFGARRSGLTRVLKHAEHALQRELARRPAPAQLAEPPAVTPSIMHSYASTPAAARPPEPPAPIAPSPEPAASAPAPKPRAPSALPEVDWQ